MNHKARWHTHADGYNKELWLLDSTDRIVGTVSGSAFNRHWCAFKETPSGSECLGQYLDEKAAKRAVEAVAVEGRTKTLAQTVEVQP